MLARILASCLLALTFAGPAGATSVLPLQLDQIVDGAAVAFHGTCIDNRTELDTATNMVVTYTTFTVQEVLKGTVPPTYVIKQIGGRMPAGQMSYRVDGIPTFSVGADYVVLLAGVSSAGFSSPVGLAQGKFSVMTDGESTKVSNGRDFREMAAGISSPVLAKAMAKALDGKPVRSVDLADFKQLVRERAGRPR